MASEGDHQEPRGLVRRLVKVAGLLGIVEGLVWVLFSAGAVVLYYNDFTPSNNNELSSLIYSGFFNKSNNSAPINGFIMNPRSMSYFSFVYLLASFCWFVISCFLLWSVKRNYKSLYDYSVFSWTVVASFSSILDLILLSLLAHDYSKIPSSSHFELERIAVGILMTFSARGFVLWIINVLFAVVLGMHYYKKYYQTSPNTNRPTIDAYLDPLPWLQGPAAFDDPPLKIYDNKGFQHDEPASRSNPPSIHHQYPIDNDVRDSARNNYANTGNNNQPQIYFKRPALINHNNNNNDGSWIHKNRGNYARAQPEPEFSRTAKIGRQRSPPLNVGTPYIPDPDYSPPGTPNRQQQGAILRPKSNYNAMY